MHNPLHDAEFLVIEFDHTGGGLSVVDGVTYSVEESSRQEARRRAGEVAQEAIAAGRSCTYMVVRIATDTVYFGGFKPRS